MNPLKDYCKYLAEKNLDALIDLFADEMLFDDRGGQDLGRAPFIKTDKQSYREAMNTVFNAPGEWVIKYIDSPYGNILYYDVIRDGICLPCVGVCRTDNQGKIKEYKVFVREE